jgi:hypothetical protein
VFVLITLDKLSGQLVEDLLAIDAMAALFHADDAVDDPTGTSQRFFISQYFGHQLV